MTRCEFTDLEASMCAHCRPAPQSPAGGHTSPAEPGTLPPQQRPWFTALYGGRCAACGTPYTPGTQIRLEVPHGWRAQCCRNT
jgi:hypothetical protein